MEPLLPGWKIIDGVQASASQDISAVLVTGALNGAIIPNSPLPENVVSSFVWFDMPYPAEQEEYINMKKDLAERFNSKGWNIRQEDIFLSDLNHEESYADLINGKITEIGLQQRDNFVVWDEYGLPLTREQYTKETLMNFLNKHTYINNICKILTE